MITADIHSHTLYSHAKDSSMDMLESAWSKGLQYFGFSEHSPRPANYNYPADYQKKLEKGFSTYVHEVLALKEAEKIKNTGRKVLLGMEVDFLPDELDFAHKLCTAYPFDYIIGGLHFQNTWGFDYSSDDWKNLPEEKCHNIYSLYYKDLARMCNSGFFHIVAHPDLIKIFSIDKFNAWLKTNSAKGLIHTALKAIQDNNMALEISSAGLRKPCKEIYPGPAIMSMARDLRIPISVASDAHNTGDVAFAFDELEKYARSFDYTQHIIFIDKKPILIPFT